MRCNLINIFYNNKGGSMSKKTSQLLVYLTKNHSNAPLTSLMKLSYLVDLVHIRKGGKQISDFVYQRYTYGPFDKKIYTYLLDLTERKVLYEITDFASPSIEYIIYKFSEDVTDYKFDKLSSDEMQTIDEVLTSLEGYGAKTLSDLAYKTTPMRALGATPGGDEHLNEVLDLHAK